MSYTTAKTAFEAAVKGMQAELERYIGSGKANQRAVDIKTDIINKLVEFYEAAEAHIEQLQEANNTLSSQYNKLHTHAGRLVLFAELHGINPNLIFYYSHDELLQMLNQGLRIRAPIRDINEMTITGVDAEGMPILNTESKETAADYDAKYQRLNLLCRKRY